MERRGLGGFLTTATATMAVVWQGLVAWPLPNLATAADLPRGAGSCSATACHGGMQPSPWGKALRNEHTTWITRDRHGDAYQVLTGDRSKAIEARLPGPKVLAENDTRCLACHATPVASADPVALPALLSDGVGCESCHGPSDRWIARHTEQGWAAQTPRFKAGFGMVPTADLVSRARVCAGCHVGAPARDGLPARDVNHDLIAAGHPRLNFEFSAYLANMAHHWRDDVGPDAAAGFPARAWAIGQLVSAQAALDLLRDRAEKAERVGLAAEKAKDPAPWPEFTEFGCFSCHHDLRDDRWRRQPPALTSPPGRSKWGSWHYPLLASLAEIGPKAEGEALRSALNNLRRLMDGPNPDPAEVAREAAATSGLLTAWIDKLSARDFDATLVDQLYARVADLQARGEVRSWDEATQRYLALVPLSQALQMLGSGATRTEDRRRVLTGMLNDLKYPDGYDSPKSFNPTAAATTAPIPAP